MADLRDGTGIGRAQDMTFRSLILVDDGRGEFGPLCDLRPVFGLRTGVGTQAERIAERLGLSVAAYRVPERLAGCVAASSGVPTNAPSPRPDDASESLVINGRLIATAAQVARCRALLASSGERVVVTAEGSLVAARLGANAADSFLSSGTIPESIERVVASVDLLATPWQILDGLGAAISEDIQRLRDRGESGYRELPADYAGRMGPHPVLLHTTAAIAPFVVFDASAGPILVGEGATIRPFAVLCGPCAIGAGSTVADRALIKPNTTCGPHCRLGGEIGGTSIVGFSNKTHDGHLGDSVIGEWVNLGAGTDNSNLLNTYGEVPVRLEPDGPRQRSGRIFLGAIIGDHVKCAIGTRLMTGTVIGTGAMIASSTPPPSTVERFAWITDEGARRYALPKFVEVMRTVMRRRALAPSDAYVALVERLHATAVSASAGAERGERR
jgi:UDP-N-acetylglucosamine diphosphorylase / glucose-1-phosphate thymidylyltransferase / UDP-N-acetylgalactosamine diphosphorylase / glucosamine-1-phosphate N-acetyltransferase / galactosamine-1-phosphate N-acetyltransferase